jgi:GxxExxY protein
MTENELSYEIIGAAIEIHRNLGPGLLESAYEECLCYELKQKRIRFDRQLLLPMRYKEVVVKENMYRLDIWVERKVVVDVKSVETILPVHKKQVLTYLQQTGSKLGLLLNFSVPVMKDGIERVVLGLDQ